MGSSVPHQRPDRGLLLPAMLLAVLSAALLSEVGRLKLDGLAAPAEGIIAPQTVVLAPAAFAYRPSGEYEQGGVEVAAPLIKTRLAGPLEITKFQVGAADYARCVAAGACKPAHPRVEGEGDVPVTGVSFYDAEDYADWLSRATGETWRLPTVEEWDFAAAGMAIEHGSEGLSADPAHPWLADLNTPATPRASLSPLPLARGRFGANSLGVADMGGNVWEWTDDCNSRTRLAPDGTTLRRTDLCGVRVVEGAHRMPISAFVQDTRGGGCFATGVPPTNLGFRLVRETRWYDLLTAPIRRLLAVR